MKSILVVCLLTLAGCATTTLTPTGVSGNLSLQAADTSRLQPLAVSGNSEAKPKKGLWIGIGLGIAAAMAAGNDNTATPERNAECLAVGVC